MADRKLHPHSVLVLTGDPYKALEVVFTAVHVMSVPVVDETQAVFRYTSPAAANLKGIRVSGRCGRAVTGLPLIKREMSMSRVEKGVLMLTQHQFSTRPWLCFVVGTLSA